MIGLEIIKEALPEHLEEIKKIAINELGMKYAKEGQVIIYSGEGSDYVRQYKAIPSGN